MGDQEPKDENNSGWMTFLSQGMQLAGTVGLFVFLGYWLDSSMGWSPWGMVAGGLLGSGVGLYQFVKSTSV